MGFSRQKLVQKNVTGSEERVWKARSISNVSFTDLGRQESPSQSDKLIDLTVSNSGQKEKDLDS